MIGTGLCPKTYRSTILSFIVRISPVPGGAFKKMEEKSKQGRTTVFDGVCLLSRWMALVLAAGLLAATCFAQDWVRTGSNLGVEKVHLAVPDFKPSTNDPQNAALLKTFNDTFWNDLDNSGVVELVSKSFYPLEVPGQPTEVTFGLWNAPPPNAAMLAFGNLAVAAGKVTVQG